MTTCTHATVILAAGTAAVCPDCNLAVINMGAEVLTLSIHDALRTVANDDPDRCRDRNDVGFGAFDSEFGCKLAASERLSAKAEMFAARLVYKYRKQVAANYAIGGGLKGKKLAEATEQFVFALAWTYQAPLVQQTPKYNGRITAVIGERTGVVKHFVVRFPYDQTMVDKLKVAVPYHARRFEKLPKPQWIVEGAHRADLLTFAEANNFEVSPACRALLEVAA